MRSLERSVEIEKRRKTVKIKDRNLEWKHRRDKYRSASLKSFWPLRRIPCIVGLSYWGYVGIGRSAHSRWMPRSSSSSSRGSDISESLRGVGGISWQLECREKQGWPIRGEFHLNHGPRCLLPILSFSYGVREGGTFFLSRLTERHLANLKGLFIRHFTLSL